MRPVHIPVSEYDDARYYLGERSTVRDGCYVWDLRTSEDGYGKMAWKGQDWRVHRFAYHYLVDYLPKSTMVHHRCSNKACWRPEHLQAVSHVDNAAEMLGRVYYQEEIQYLRDRITELEQKLADAEARFDDFIKEEGWHGL